MLDPLRTSRDAQPVASIGARRLGALCAVCLAVTLVVMDGSIVNVALPTLSRSLGGVSNSGLQWIVDGYILVFATLLLPMGNLADRFGRRRMLVLGAALFGATSVGAAYATSTPALVGWRAAMGVGAAMVFPSTLAILTHAFPEPRLRRMAIGAWAGCSGLGVAIGPVVGGWLLRHYAWGSIFLVNVPIVALIAIAATLSVEESRERRPGRFDAIGSLLVVAGLTALVWGLIEAPERGWTSLSVAGAFLGAALLLVLFVVHQRSVEHPTLDLRLVASRACSSACLAIGAAFFGLFGFVFMVTQFFQFVRGHDPLEAGVRTLPFAGAVLLGASLAALLGRRVEGRWICAAGLGCMAIGFAWARVDGADTAYLVLVGQMGVLGSGLGLVSAAATEMVMGSLASDRLGLASSLNDTARELGGTLGVALTGSVFNAIYRADVEAAFSGSPLPETAVRAARQSLGAAIGVAERVAEMAGPVAAARVRGPVVEAFLAGFHGSSLVAAAVAAGAALLVAAVMPGALAIGADAPAAAPPRASDESEAPLRLEPRLSPIPAIPTTGSDA